MPPDLIEAEVVAARLGVDLDTPAGDDLRRLTAAVSAEIRALTRRGLEGDEGGSYDETYRLDGARELTLRHVPVGAIASVGRVALDGTADDPWESTQWRLEDAARGRIRLSPSANYVRVVYTATGDIPAYISQAAADWIASRWGERDRSGGQTSYSTGKDSESWDPKLAGTPPGNVARALGLAMHLTGAVI